MRERTSYGELQPYAERVSRIPSHTYALSSPSSGADRAQRSEGIENVPALCLMHMRELLRQMLLVQHHLMRQRIRIYHLGLPFPLLIAGAV